MSMRKILLMLVVLTPVAVGVIFVLQNGDPSNRVGMAALLVGLAIAGFAFGYFRNRPR
jgi:hypothetical protein